MELIAVLLAGLAIGVFVGWVAGRSTLRESFRALSAEALRINNESFLQLAESRLREARTEATADIDDRKKAIEGLLAPMKATLEQVDREMRDSERRRAQTSTELIQRIASLDTAGQDLRSQTGKLVLVP